MWDNSNKLKNESSHAFEHSWAPLESMGDRFNNLKIMGRVFHSYVMVALNCFNSSNVNYKCLMSQQPNKAMLFLISFFHL